MTKRVGDFLRCGLSYRDLYYWTRRNFINPDNPTPGSGVPMSWPDAELEVAALVKRLRAVGFELEAAADLARSGRAEAVLTLLER